MKTFDEDERPVFFSPLVGNRLDPISVFSDCGVHQRCLDAHPAGRQALEIQAMAIQAWKDRACQVCGGPIDHPDEYEGTGCFSSDPETLIDFQDPPLPAFRWRPGPRVVYGP